MIVKNLIDNQAEVFDYSAENLSKANCRFFVVNYRLEYRSCQKKNQFEER
jgi:hypothetical protein